MSVHEDRSADGCILPEDDDPSEGQTGETPEKRACAVTQLTAMIQERGEVVPHRMDDAFLIRFLRAKHMNVAYSHELLVNYYNFKKNNPDLTEGVSPTDARVSAVYEEDIGSVLPYRDQLRRHILPIKMKSWNPSVVHVNDILKATVFFLEMAVIERGLSLRHETQFTPKVASNILQLTGLEGDEYCKMSQDSAPKSVDLNTYLELGEPSAELLEEAQLLLGESPDTRACAVQSLSDMIYEKGEVEAHRMDEEFLIRFLRAKYYDVDKAHHLMANYYNFKKSNPSYITDVSMWGDVFTHIRTEEIISVFPYRDQLGRRVIIVKVAKWDPSLCSVDDLLKAALMVLECAMLEQHTQISGGVCFFDMKGLSMRHIFQMSPNVANKVLQLMGLSIPIRVLEVHILNQSKIYDMLFAMFKPFLTKKMQSIVHFHGSDFKSLHKFIDPKYLPEEYEGTQPPFNAPDWYDTLTTHPAMIKELESLGYTDVHKP